jgi:glycosyltransferase involved in cell wall biosynthesis
VKKLSETLGLQQQVMWTGEFTTGAEIAELIHAVDVFVLPFDDGAHLNNSSIATLASYGAAIVTTRMPHTDPQFVDGKNMLLCPVKDPPAIRAAVESLIADRARLVSLRAGSLQLAKDWFSWDRAMQFTLSALTADTTDQHGTRATECQ